MYGLVNKAVVDLVVSKFGQDTWNAIVAELVDAARAGRLADGFVKAVETVGALLSELGRVQRPVLLKRGLSATVTELLMAAEYIMSHGNREVVLCERGIRTFEPMTRNTLDVAAIPVLKLETHLPVIVDPSHAGGRADLVAPLSFAAVAAGADGLIVEVHPTPQEALSDGDQSLTPESFATLLQALTAFAQAAGRDIVRAVAEPVAA